MYTFWTNLNSIIILITFGYVGFMILWVSKKLNARSIQNSEDFFSYPKQDSSFTATKLLERTFEATNASFTTAFLGLFALALFNSLYTFSIIVGYILGIVFFAKKLLIKCLPFIKAHKFYPFVLEEKTGDKRIRIFSAIIIILSLLFFYFTEVYGFSITFLGGSGSLTKNQLFITVKVTVNSPCKGTKNSPLSFYCYN